ncbi:hypothetical protein Tco_0024122 [Tanacetum coccineum]
MKEQAYNIDRDKDHKSLMTKAISLISRRSVAMNSLRGRLLALNIELNKEVRSLRILSLGDSWDFKDVQDYHPEAEKLFDEAAEAFYKLQFLYISLSSGKAG